MPAASILIKPASSNCNMDCKYCFYKVLSSNREQYNLGMMTEDTLENLIREAVKYADGLLTFAFQGGEPTLCGLDFFKKAIELQHKYKKEKPGLRIENTLQTNGISINEEWCKFFHENDFLIGLSLDGTKKLHNLARVKPNGDPTFDKVMNAASMMKKYDVPFNILTVVTESIADKASALYNFYKRNEFPYVQLIPCMDEICRGNSRNDVNPYAVTPKTYGRFLCEFFDLWYADFAEWVNRGRTGYVMDVRMFSNLAQMSVGYPPEECGMNGFCSCYFVVEGDGSVYPCDFYCFDEWKLGTVETPFEELIQSEKVGKFLEAGKLSDNHSCRGCEHYSFCRGGCRRWREATGEDRNINYLCEGYKMFFDHTSDRIKKLGQTIINPYIQI